MNHHPDVFIDGVHIPLCRTPKILGMTFESLFCYRDHILAICAKATQRINILKAVCRSTWGHDKETLIITYKVLVESLFSYAASVWFPNCKPTNIEKLQFIQNTAMCLITDCHRASSVDHLLAETKMMRVLNY
jgi:hypothetical protein